MRLISSRPREQLGSDSPRVVRPPPDADATDRSIPRPAVRMMIAISVNDGILTLVFNRFTRAECAYRVDHLHIQRWKSLSQGFSLGEWFTDLLQRSVFHDFKSVSSYAHPFHGFSVSVKCLVLRAGDVLDQWFDFTPSRRGGGFSRLRRECTGSNEPILKKAGHNASLDCPICSFSFRNEVERTIEVSWPRESQR